MPPCQVGDDAWCESSGELHRCFGGAWQSTDCDQFCGNVALVPLGCGEDPETGLAACLCGGDPSATSSAGGSGELPLCAEDYAECSGNGDCCGFAVDASVRDALQRVVDSLRARGAVFVDLVTPLAGRAAAAEGQRRGEERIPGTGDVLRRASASFTKADGVRK